MLRPFGPSRSKTVTVHISKKTLRKSTEHGQLAVILVQFKSIHGFMYVGAMLVSNIAEPVVLNHILVGIQLYLHTLGCSQIETLYRHYIAERVK